MGMVAEIYLALNSTTPRIPYLEKSSTYITRHAISLIRPYQRMRLIFLGILSVVLGCIYLNQNMGGEYF